MRKGATTPARTAFVSDMSLFSTWLISEQIRNIGAFVKPTLVCSERRGQPRSTSPVLASQLWPLRQKGVASVRVVIGLRECQKNLR